MQKKPTGGLKLAALTAPKSTLLKAVVAALFLLLLTIAIIIINQPDSKSTASSASKYVYVSARVAEVVYDDAEPDQDRAEGRRIGKQELNIQILSGEHKGEILPLTNYLSALSNVDVKEGTRIIVHMVTNQDGSYYPMMLNYDRGLVLGGVVLLFAALLVAIGGKKGLKALLGLLFTLICLWFLMIPLMLRGFSPIGATILLVVITTAASLVILDGFSRKALTAILGCVAGVSVAGLAAAITGIITPLSGYNMGEAETLMMFATDSGMTISGFMVCGVLIASLGAVMDVSMSIASSIHELRTLNPQLSARKLFASGMNIGRDAMGTMANTLILAFAGSSLNMLVLTFSYRIPFLQLINSDFIVVEILQSVAGSLGIILTVPVVAAIGAWIMSRPNSQNTSNM